MPAHTSPLRSATLASLALTLASAALPAHAAPSGEVAAATVATATPVTTDAPRIEPDAPIETRVQEHRHDPFAAALGDGRIVAGPSAHRALHFTFDDGPGVNTPELLDVLEQHHVHATFFLVARQLETERGRRVAREIADRGHTIGLHSYRHDDLTALDAMALRRDLDRAERVYEEVFEARAWLFRPPYGRHDEAVDAELATRGYTEVLWNITAGDGSAHSAEEVVEAFRTSLDRQERMARGAGGVVIFHDTHRWVVEAMPAIFDEIAARNCALLEEESETGDQTELWDVHDDLTAWHAARGHAAATRQAARMRLSDVELAARQSRLREDLPASCR